MITVKLIAKTDVGLEALASHAARTCYNPQLPEMGNILNVKGQLFDTGHHTTLEHNHYTFAIDGLAVGDVTFGLHLCHPFYNTDQRSGRFCMDMFANPDRAHFEAYIAEFWPEVNPELRRKAVDYVMFAAGLFTNNQDAAVKAAEKAFAEERPFYPENNRAATCRKIAQEQLRCLVPIIFPTGLDITVDFITLVSMYKNAWTPVMRYVTAQMADQVKAQDPLAAAVFSTVEQSGEDWAPDMIKSVVDESRISRPSLELLEYDSDVFTLPKAGDLHPIDSLHFSPRFMDMNASMFVTGVELSLATYGQDQRHRTVRRSTPFFTGRFYVPPVVVEAGLATCADDVMSLWLALCAELPPTLATNLAPYGATVQYVKTAPLNALLHEGGKRLCWNAQEEIYQLSRQLVATLEAKGAGEVAEFLAPPCHLTGRCGEGGRYCGRPLDEATRQRNYYPARKV